MCSAVYLAQTMKTVLNSGYFSTGEIHCLSDIKKLSDKNVGLFPICNFNFFNIFFAHILLYEYTLYVFFKPVIKSVLSTPRLINKSAE